MDILFFSNLSNINERNTVEWLDNSLKVFGKASGTFEIKNASEAGFVNLTYNHASFDSPEFKLYDVVIGKFTFNTLYIKFYR